MEQLLERVEFHSKVDYPPLLCPVCRDSPAEQIHEGHLRTRNIQKYLGIATLYRCTHGHVFAAFEQFIGRT